MRLVTGLTAAALYDAIAQAAPGHIERQELLHETFRLQRTHLRDILSRIASEHGLLMTPAQVDDFVSNASPQSRLELEWDALSPRLQRYSEHPDGLVDRILVRNLDSARVAAFSMRTDDGGLVVVDAALHDFTYLCIKLAIARFRTAPEEQVTSAELSGRVARVSLGNIRHYGRLWTPFTVELAGHRFMVATEAADAAMAFVLAHEYAHLMWEHGGAGGRKLGFGPDVEFIDCADPEQEFRADMFAAIVTLDPSAPSSGWPVRLLGIRMALESLELFSDTFAGPAGTGHPPPALRFDAVLRAVGLHEESQDAGPLTMLNIAEQFGADVRSRQCHREDLLDSVAADQLISLSDQLDMGAELSRILTLDRLESLRLMDPLPCFAQLGRELFPEEVFKNPHPEVRVAVEKVVEEMLGRPAEETERRMILQSAVGQEWLLRGLHEMVGIDTAISLMSPKVGQSHSDWLAPLSEVLPEPLSLLVGVCLEKLVKRSPRRLLPYPEEFDALAWHWVLLTHREHLTEGVPWPPRPANG